MTTIMIQKKIPTGGKQKKLVLTFLPNVKIQRFCQNDKKYNNTQFKYNNT